MPTFTSLPPHLQYNIFLYSLVPHARIDNSVVVDKLEYYGSAQRYETLTRVWSEFIQRHLWREILVRYDEIGVLRTMLDNNPRLCAYTEKLSVIDASIASSIAATAQYAAIKGRLEPLFTSANYKPVYPQTSSTFRQIWTSLVSLITDKLAHAPGGIFRSLSIRCDFRNTLRIAAGNNPKPIFVDLPTEDEFLKSVRLPTIQYFSLMLGGSRESIPPGKINWNAESIGVMIGAMAPGLKDLNLEVSADWVGERTTRRGVYVSMTNLLRRLTPPLYPHLTKLTIRYLTLHPSNPSQTGVYSYTTLDDGKDLFSRALRILSKQLVHFTAESCRISTTLFTPDPEEPEEPLHWPHLKTYRVLMGQLTSSGDWLWGFNPHHRDPPPAPPTPIPATAHTATDTLIPPFDWPPYSTRHIPIRDRLDLFFAIASHAMASYTHTPSLEHWYFEAQMNYLFLEFLSSSKNAGGGAQIRWNAAYAHPDEVINAWVQRCEERGEGVTLDKIPSRGLYGLEFMAEEDRRFEEKRERETYERVLLMRSRRNIITHGSLAE